MTSVEDLPQTLIDAVAKIMIEKPPDSRQRLVELLSEPVVNPAPNALDFGLTNGHITVRPMTEDDLDAAANICNTAFNTFNETVSLPPEFPPVEVIDVPKVILSQSMTDGFDGFVAVNEAGKVIGSNMVEWRDEVAGIGPITVETGQANAGAGRLLMKAVMKAAAKRGRERVCLLQLAANHKSFSLYLDLGFSPTGPCGEYEGFYTGEVPTGFTSAALAADDVAECDALHLAVRGVHRAKDIAFCVENPMPACTVREGAGKIVAYTTGSYLGGHTVATSQGALIALVAKQSEEIRAAQAAGAPVGPPGLILPHTYPDIIRILARNGFRLKRQLAQMGYGPVLSSKGIYLPAVQY